MFLSISLTMLTIVSWLLERFVPLAAYHTSISAGCFSDDVHEVTFPIGVMFLLKLNFLKYVLV